MTLYMVFAKIFNVKHPTTNEGHQVLYVTTYDSDEDSYILRMRTDINSVECTISAGFYEEEKMHEAFRNANQELAQEFFEDMLCQNF